MLSGSAHKHFVFLSLIVLLLLPISVHGLLWHEVFNSAHTLVFIYFFAYLFSQLQRWLPESKIYLTYIYSIGLGLLVAVLVELLQYFVGREMSLDDVYRDILGLLSGAVLIAYRGQRRPATNKKMTLILLLSFVFFIYLAVSKLMNLSWHYVQRASTFPVILELDNSWSNSFVHFNRAEYIAGDPSIGRPTDGYHQIKFMPGLYPGFSITETVADWSQYQSLNFKVFSEYDKELYMTIRVHDFAHNQEHEDRFNKRIRIYPGENTISVLLSDIRDGPVNRQLALSEIAGLTLFISDLDEVLRFYISDIRLI